MTLNSIAGRWDRRQHRVAMTIVDSLIDWIYAVGCAVSRTAEGMRLLKPLMVGIVVRSHACSAVSASSVIQRFIRYMHDRVSPVNEVKGSNDQFGTKACGRRQC
jgi:hypothetical protein